MISPGAHPKPLLPPGAPGAHPNSVSPFRPRANGRPPPPRCGAQRAAFAAWQPPPLGCSQSRRRAEPAAGAGPFSTAPGRGLRRGRAGQRGTSQGSAGPCAGARGSSERRAGLRPPLPAGRALDPSGVAAPLWSAMAWLPGGLAELRWGALVALFVAALATLAVYLVQYALLALRRGRPPPAPAPPVQRDELLEEGGSVLAWALSRGSWRRQWRRAWVAALRAEAAERAVSAGMQVMDGGREGTGDGRRRLPRARWDGAGASRPWGIAPGRGSGRSPL